MSHKYSSLLKVEGGYLAFAEDGETNRYLREYMRKSKIRAAWIGLSDQVQVKKGVDTSSERPRSRASRSYRVSQMPRGRISRLPLTPNRMENNTLFPGGELDLEFDWTETENRAVLEKRSP